MSARLSHFRPRDENPISPWPDSSPPSYPEAVYVIGMRAVENRIEYYFVEQPDGTKKDGDAPLTIRVLKHTTIVLKLDPKWDWSFAADTAVVIGPVDHPEKGRYFNLKANSKGEVRFLAQYLDIGTGNADPYAIYLSVGQGVNKDGVDRRLLVRIDPDMLNPGDHDPPPPPPEH